MSFLISHGHPGRHHHQHRHRSARPGLLPIAVIVVTLVLAVVLLPSAGRAAVPAVDWSALPTTPQAAPGGFTIEACAGDAPLLCVQEGDQAQGLVEHLAFTLDSFDELARDIAAGVSVHDALLAEIGRFSRAVREDRVATCPDTYTFQTAPTVSAVVAGNEGVRYGFSVLGERGNLVERGVGFMTLRTTAEGTMVSVLAASELNDGACVDSSGTLPFTDGGLGRFVPTLTGIAARADLGEGSTPAPLLPADTVLTAADPVGAAIAASQAAVADGGASTVLLSRDDDFADALASGTAQGVLDAPLLLTGSDVLDPRVEAELDRLGATEVVVLGGEAAVTPPVVDALTDTGVEVRRLAGDDRVATALAIAEAYAPVTERVVLARADAGDGDPTAAFADALGAGSLAADQAVPLLLTAGDVLDERVVEWLAGSGIEQVAVVGGEAAIGQPVLQRLVEEGYGLAVLAGDGRAETAARIAEDRGLPSPDHADAVVVVDGRDWVGGLTGTLLAHRFAAPIVLSDGDVLPPATRSFLDLANPSDPPRLVCGVGVTPTACEAAGRLIRQ